MFTGTGFSDVVYNSGGGTVVHYLVPHSKVLLGLEQAKIMYPYFATAITQPHVVTELTILLCSHDYSAATNIFQLHNQPS